MIAERLILWHAYRGGLAFDLSENRNHGHLRDVALGAGPFSSALQFSGGDSEVRVEPSPSLTNLREVRAQVHFHWDPSAPNVRRHNLIEGQLAFALFVNPDGSLQGTILNQLGSWEGATSAPGVVPIGEWHTAEFVHDGIGHCTLYLDGHVVAEGFSSPGPVRSVGPNGVAIGHWPEQPDQYTLEGYIDLVKVWCDDPVKNGGELVDDCCIDRPAIAANSDRLRDRGLDSTSLGELVRGLFDIGRRAAYWITEGSATDRDHAYDLSRQLMIGYEHGDQGTMGNAIMRRGADAGGQGAGRRRAGHVGPAAASVGAAARRQRGPQQQDRPRRPRRVAQTVVPRRPAAATPRTQASSAPAGHRPQHRSRHRRRPAANNLLAGPTPVSTRTCRTRRPPTRHRVVTVPAICCRPITRTAMVPLLRRDPAAPDAPSRRR